MRAIVCKTLGAVFGVATLLAGCGGGTSTAVVTVTAAPSTPTTASTDRSHAGSAAPTATPSAASSDTPATQAVWSLAEACAYYKGAQAKYRPSIEAYNAADGRYAAGNASWTKVRDASISTAAATRAYVRSLRNPPHSWPADLASDIAAVVKFRLAVAGGLDNMGSAASAGDFRTWYEQPWTSQSLTDAYNTASQSLKVTCA